MRIKDNYKEEIFKPFKCVHAGKSGTGQGLTICRKIVEVIVYILEQSFLNSTQIVINDNEIFSV